MEDGAVEPPFEFQRSFQELTTYIDQLDAVRI
jgi:hypothetical protein